MDRGRERRFDDQDGGYNARGYRNDRGGFRGGRSPARNAGYRPGRSPPRRSPSRRSPPPTRRGRTPPPYDNGYSAASRGEDRPRSRSPRRRSRSPHLRERDDGFGQRARPYREERRRSPPPFAQGGRSPFDAPPGDAPPRDGSPPPMRGRERSPPAAAYRQYSPAPKHPHYPNNGDEEFERRDAPPPRDESWRYQRDSNYRSRGRSRSPYRVSAHASHADTPNSSRRSSPRSYGDRMRIDKPSPGYGSSRFDQTVEKPPPRHPNRERSPARRPYSPPRARSPAPRDLSPPARSPPRRGYSPPPRSPQDDAAWPRNRGAPPPDRDVASRDRNEPYQDRGYASRDRQPYPVGQTSRTWRKPSSPEGGYPAREERSPMQAEYPQEGYREPPPRQPSPGPAAPPSHRVSVLHAPSQPRGGRGGPAYPREPRGESREAPFPRDEPPPYRSRDEGPFRGRDEPYRGDRGRGRGYGGGPPRGGSFDSRPSPAPRGPSYHSNFSPTSPPPRSGEGGLSEAGGGRGGRGEGPGGPGGRGAGPAWEYPPRGPPFRSNNSSSTTYPRTQVFNTPKNHMSGLAQAVEGGKKAPSSLEPAQEKRLAQLEEERKKLMEQIEEKQRVKRQVVREWDTAERESKREGMKAELAEGHLEKMSGETSAGGAY